MKKKQNKSTKKNTKIKYKGRAENMNDEKLTIDNIDEIRDELDSNYYDAIKATVLNLVEVSYKKELENNKIDINSIDKIVNRIVESDEFNDYMDSFIQDEIRNVFKENEILEEEEER